MYAYTHIYIYVCIQKCFRVRKILAEGRKLLGMLVHCSSGFQLDFQLKRNIVNICRHVYVN